MDTDWAGFSAAWRRGFEEILIIRIVRGGTDHRELSRRRLSTLLRWLGLSYGPVLISLLLPLGRAPVERAALLLVVGTINAGMFGAAAAAWGYALRRAGTIDDLLRPSPHRDAVPNIIHRAVALRRQATLPVIFMFMPWLVPTFTGLPAWTGWAAFVLAVNLTWTMFLLGCVSYWLIVPPLLVLKIRSWRTLAVRWNDPARTPGMRTFSEGYAYSALFLVLAAFALTVPGLLGLRLFGPYLPYLYTLLIVLSAWVGLTTQVVIYSIVRRIRLQLLNDLAEKDSLTLTENHAPDIAARINLNTSNTLAVYGSIAGAPGLPYGTALVVQYIAALVGSIAGFLLQ